ncbi:MAG: PINc/VapC family ATPase [Candidatus Nanohaloarchaeota archaeon QJJ-9]|nr:PINc/VapC family ATPase [Candidatus Nanohaloarchaeota archaeon QJJ-9]
MSREKVVPDTSIIIDGKLSELVEEGILDSAKVFVSEAVVDELENQANHGKEIGDAGLDELEELQELASSHDINIEFVGRRPTQEEIGLAKSGRIDALIRDLAEERDATLYTADFVQSKVANAKGIDCQFFEKEEEVSFSIVDYFDDETMSVHLKQGRPPKAKKGMPGEIKSEEIGDQSLGYHEIDEIARETFEKAKSSEDGLVEMNMNGSTVLQVEDLRIVITRPPFSEKVEITAVRPVRKVGLDDYSLTGKFKERLKEKAEGILVAGAPGHGKSTFAQALAEFYDEQDKVVKTMEKPRDLQVGGDITQYSSLEGDMENTGDVLLLVRPDYTVFDEVRKTPDFDVFSDMRLAGVGMIGVVHASEALDAVQRLIGRVELGVIPQVVDTVVFIEDAEVAKVYKLELTVKVPTGMTEEDLARPVIQILDFEDDSPEYEIYTYGEETVVIPVEDQEEETSTQKLAREQLEHKLSRWVSNPNIEFVGNDRVKVYVDEEEIPRLIGSNGENIHSIEDEIGLNITVEPRNATLKQSAGFEVSEVGNSVAIKVGEQFSGEEADVYSVEEHLLTATVGKNGQIRVTKESDLAKEILGAYASDKLDVRI